MYICLYDCIPLHAWDFQITGTLSTFGKLNDNRKRQCSKRRSVNRFMVANLTYVAIVDE